MPSTFSLAPIPFWVELEANGQPAANCIMYPRSSLDHQVVKNVFQDPAGTIPWPLNMDGGIVFRDNGTQGPFYWEQTGLPNDLYYLEFWTADGQLIDTVDMYPVIGGGGVTPITTSNTITNFIIDGQFSYNELPSAVVAPVPNSVVIQSISADRSLAGIGQGGWTFIKNVPGSTDSLSIVQPSLSSTSPPSNPRGILTYSCTVAGVGGTRLDATYLTRDCKSFQNQTFRFQFQAQASGSAPIGVASEVFIRQRFGTGGSPSLDVEVPFPFVWPTSFAPVSFTITVPSTAGKVRGTNNDDFFEIGIRFPLNSTGVYQITNVMGVQGTLLPMNYIYETQAETFYKISDSIQLIPTGTLMQRWSAVAPPGWVLLENNGSFGNLSSAALHKGDAFFNLFSFLWNNLPNTFAPVVPSGRGASALADWNANKSIFPPPTTNCVFGNASGSSTFTNGEVTGDLTHTLVPAELPPLSVTVPTLTGLANQVSHAPPLLFSNVNTVHPVQPPGLSTPFSLLQPTAFIYTFIKL